MILTESAIYARYVVVFPALALLAALGLRTVAALLWPMKSRWRTGVVVVIAAVLAVGQITYFFGPHLTRYNDQLRQNFDTEDPVFRSANFGWGTQVHIIEEAHAGQVYLQGIANFLTDGLTIYPMLPADLTPAYVSALSHNLDQAFFVEPFNTAAVDLLKQHFTLEGPFPSPYNVPSYRQLLLYFAKATAPAG
jgi:hypothetical protein